MTTRRQITNLAGKRLSGEVERDVSGLPELGSDEVLTGDYSGQRGELQP